MLTDKIDALLAQWDRPDTPGCALAVVYQGRVVHARGYGMASLEENIPITPTTIFHIASTSKQFTAMCVVLLAQQGALALDDDIRTYLPTLPIYDRSISIRHLLHHTSGVRECLTLWALAGGRVADCSPNGAVLALLARQRGLNFSPGECYQYNNSNYFLLALIVERAGGRSLGEFAEERIFGPLGMHDSSMHDPPVHQAQRAYGYMRSDEDHYLRVPDGIGVYGAAGVFTTLEDLVRWDQNFYHPRVGGAEVMRQMLTPGALDDRRPIHYAAGLFIHNYRGLPIVSHAGSFSGIGAQLIRFPEQQLSVICLCNQSVVNPSMLALQVAELYLADAMRPEVGLGSSLRQPTRPLEEYAGAFRDIRAGRICQVSVQDDRLAVVLPGFGFLAVPVGEERFQAVDTADPIEIGFDRVGALPRMQMQIEGEESATFVAVQLVSPEFEQLSDYVGSYFSDELQVVYRFEHDAGQLVLATIGAPLEPTIRDGFRAYGMHFEFFRDERQSVVGYTLYADGASNIRFVRVAEGAA